MNSNEPDDDKLKIILKIESLVVANDILVQVKVKFSISFLHNNISSLSFILEKYFSSLKNLRFEHFISQENK